MLRCPYCGGPCERHTDRESFLRMARRFEVLGFVGHQELMAWSQGRCFRTRAEAWTAYRSRRLIAVAVGEG
jgi:hypothetical protein